MEFRILGPLEVRTGSGPLALGGPKQRTVLALLIVHANHVVTVDRLADALWGTAPPATARNTIQTYIRHLRKALGPERIERRSVGYALVADADEVDALRFERLVDEADRRKAGDPVRAAALLEQALDLWRGPVLDDLADQPALQPEIARLEESRMAAVEDRIAANLERGRHRELVPALEDLVRRHPFRERLWGQLMLALYRSGRQADALGAYQRARAVLVEELGIDPSPELHRVEEQILRQDPDLNLAGEPLRGYRLLERIGEGAFGLVYRAHQPHVDRDVAVKVIRPDLANDPDFVRAFEREARLVARLEHQHIVPLYDYWRDPEGAYLVMRLFPAGSLRALIDRSGPLDVEAAARIAEHASLALTAAADSGVAHGDVKAENILLDHEGNAYLSDFGIAIEVGGRPSHANDVRALAAVLREALAGRALTGAVGDVLSRADDPEHAYPDALAFASAFRAAIGSSVGEPPTPATEMVDPYKGLRSFEEPDAPDFFGRERMVDRLVERLTERAEGFRLLGVVGPSGSGKSSLVRAGLLPALRRGAVEGSASWFTTEMTPGAHPFHELEDALLRVAIDPPPNLVDELQRERGLVGAVDQIIPADARTQLFLVIDQFEELFTITVSDPERVAFLAAIADAATNPASRVRIVLVLRADFYDRPLLDPHLGPLLAARSEVITPLAPDELAAAITLPAQRVGVSVEPALVAEALAEVAEQPSALPMLQFALTELFERRDGRTMTAAAYREVGRVSGALVGRAEKLYATFDASEREACRQAFLRLVEPGEGTEDTRRRLARSQLDALALDRGAIDRVIDVFGRHRFLAFDRDAATREPTVELAHEALIRVWGRLRDWVDESREDLRTHARLVASADEWLGAHREPSFLLGGERLNRVAAWSEQTGLALDPEVREFIDDSLARRRDELHAEQARAARERALERRSVRRLRALVAVLAAASLVASGLTLVAVGRSRDAERLHDEATVAALTEAAVSRLTSEPLASISLALYAIDVNESIREPIPAATLEALHWALQEAGLTYPVPEARTAVVAGPGGTRGVFDLPIAQLLAFARANVTDGLPPADCKRFFGDATCPSLPDRFASSVETEPLRAIPRTPGRPLAGTQVTVFGGHDPTRIEILRDLFAPFTRRTGIQVRLVGNPMAHDYVAESVAAGDAPDLAFFGQVPTLLEIARSRNLIDLGAFLDLLRLRAEQSPYLVRLGTMADDGSWPAAEGRMFGAFVDVDVKSLLWYPVASLASAGYDVPRTWADVLTLDRRLRRSGRRPWCMGWLAEGADGWPGTDWIENLMMLEGGPELYDAWTVHEFPFQSRPVRTAFRRLGRFLFAGHAAEAALHTGFDAAQLPMLSNPPGCWLYQFASFASAFLPAGTVGATTDFVPFPSAPGRPQALIGGGEIMAAFSDRPEVRAVVRFILGRSFGEGFARSGAGIPANRHVPLDAYPAEQQRLASLVTSALAADTWRFDASDLMPYRIGAGLFFRSMMRYAAHGPGNLDRILARLDAAWPDDG